MGQIWFEASNGIGSTEGFLEILDPVSGNLGRYVVPGMNLVGIVDNPDRGGSVNLLPVEGIALPRLSGLGGVRAEVEKGLGVIGINVLAGDGSPSFGQYGPEEEFIKLGGDNAHITGTVVVGKLRPVTGLHEGCIARLTGMGGIHGIVGNQEDRADEWFIPQIVLFDGPVGRTCAVRMTGNTDLFRINIGKIDHQFDRIVHARARIRPFSRSNNIGMTVAVHIDRHDHIAAPRPLHVVQILHLPIVVPAVTGNDTRSRIFRSCVRGNKKKGAHEMS